MPSLNSNIPEKLAPSYSNSFGTIQMRNQTSVPLTGDQSLLANAEQHLVALGTLETMVLATLSHPAVRHNFKGPHPHALL